ncbi:granzyme B-like [Cynoglossus semilaevis]|uniref:Granzyme 3, tandem duplicate 4 n=1 Tax=Cynoglossus semilaevis TaxID=244447 RepID=A0A3P8W7I8_CYNSE|nr:granzyme B-like [Cynoglossus semilaevis]
MHIFCILLAFQLCSPSGQTEDGIVNGQVSKPHSRPYMASLQYSGKHNCGGLLVQEDFVLTAAHCKNGNLESTQPMTVVLGAHNLKHKEKSQQSIQVAAFYAHPKYHGKFDNDIMLLKLEKKARLNKFVQTIKLPVKDKTIRAKVACVVAGWGQKGRSEPSSDVLKEATEWTQFKDECVWIWNIYFNSSHMICTRFDKNKGGLCQGDSGGPLICKDKLVGITAFTHGEDCNNSKFPHVFTRIGHFLPWIKKTLQREKNAV